MGLLAGIITGGLGGGAQALQGMAQQDIAEQAKADLAQQLSDQELAKMKASAQFNADLQNQLREAQVARIQQARTGIVDSQVAQQYPDLPGAEDGGDNGLRNAQQSKAAAARADLMNDRDTFVDAGIATGDIPPTQAGMLTAKQQQQQSLIAWHAAHDQTLDTMNQRTNDAREANAERRADALIQVQEMKREHAATENREASKDRRAAAQQVTKDMTENRLRRAQYANALALNPNDPSASAAVQALDDEMAQLKQRQAVFLDSALPMPKPAGGKPGAPAGAASSPSGAASAPKSVRFEDLN